MDITLDDVVRKRQTQLVNEADDLNAELEAIKNRAAEINTRLAEIHLEYGVFEKAQDRRIVITHTETFSQTVRDGKNPTDRLQFEDALKAIFNRIGRPMPVRDIIKELEPMGWQWAQYHTARGYIANSDMLETAGKRGYYQLLRPRW